MPSRPFKPRWKKTTQPAALPPPPSPLTSPPIARSTPALTTKRKAKLAAATERRRAELQAVEADLASVHTELVSATAARSAAAARVAIPCASDKAGVETVAHSTTQSLSRVGEVAGPSPNANLLRDHIQRTAELVRLLATEAALASAAPPPPPHTHTPYTPTPPPPPIAEQGTPAPDDIHIDYCDEMDQDDANEEDLHLAQAVLQSTV